MGKKKDEKKRKPEKIKVDAVISADLLRNIAPAVTQAARSLRTHLTRNLAATGLYAGQDGVILALSDADGLTPGQLAQRLGVKAPTMTRTIGRMEAQGFVERRADEGDARVTRVYMAPSGQKSVEAISHSLADCGALAMQGISNKEVKAFLKVLRAIDRNLQQAEPAEI